MEKWKATYPTWRENKKAKSMIENEYGGCIGMGNRYQENGKYISWKKMEQNSFLMAAAPEMLEVLEWASKKFAMRISVSDSYKLNQAIKKAKTGKEK